MLDLRHEVVKNQCHLQNPYNLKIPQSQVVQMGTSVHSARPQDYAGTKDTTVNKIEKLST